MYTQMHPELLEYMLVREHLHIYIYIYVGVQSHQHTYTCINSLHVASWRRLEASNQKAILLGENHGPVKRTAHLNWARAAVQAIIYVCPRLRTYTREHSCVWAGMAMCMYGYVRLMYVYVRISMYMFTKTRISRHVTCVTYMYAHAWRCIFMCVNAYVR